MDPKALLSGLIGKAKTLVEDQEKLSKLIDNASKKMNENSGKLDQVKEDMATGFRMVKSWLNGSYKQIPTKSIIMLIAAVLYFVNPFDFIPDLLLHVGFIDDVAVLGFVFKTLSEELDQFKSWEESIDK